VGTRRITEGQFDYRLDTSRGDEFAQLARDFNIMTRRLNELDQMKKDFVSHVSHELKAPLASIRESLQLMLEELPGPLTVKQKRLIEINLMCARRLSSMLGNLLDLSSMDAGMMEYQLKSNDIAGLTLTAMEEYEPQAREKNLRLVAALPESSLPVHCDGDRIIQVIGNVIGNAIKFSPTGGLIEIRAQALPSLPRHLPESWRRTLSKSQGDSGFVTLSISDLGPGIPAELKEKIFKKFQQLRQEKALTGPGVGLGLAISRTIMMAHQGAIWVEDNPGGGSIFVLLLPAGSAGRGLIHTESAPI
jgi:signal transduction histidine kinase